MKIKCSCGKEVELSVAPYEPGQEGDKFVGFCECRIKWMVTDMTYEYEEMVVNEVLPPENGEYENDEGYWCYSDGSDME